MFGCHILLLLGISAPYYTKVGLQPGKEDLPVHTQVSLLLWDCIHSQLIMLTLHFVLKIPKGPICFPWDKK